MTIDNAYDAFTSAVANALLAAGFLDDPGRLRIDPEDLTEPDGMETTTQRSAMVEQVSTGAVRNILGRPEPRFVVERSCRVELMQWGPAQDTRRMIDAAAVAALALLPVLTPTLKGACERLSLTEGEETPIDPNGVARSFTFNIRIRSGDPMGTTP